MDIQTKKLNNGIEYKSCNCLSYGDYDNSCAIERANVRYLKEHDELKDSIVSYSMSAWDNGQTMEKRNNSMGFPDYYWEPIETNEKLVECYGGYSSIQLWVRSDIWDEMELEESFANYPVLDDELVSTIEIEMEDEAWDNWIKSDLIRTLPDGDNDETYNNQECHCINCGWDGIRDELIVGLTHDDFCPNCNEPYMIKFYPITEKTLREFADELDNDTLWEIYRNCCEEMNENGYCESGGNWYIDIDRLKDCFKQKIESLYSNKGKESENE